MSAELVCDPETIKALFFIRHFSVGENESYEGHQHTIDHVTYLAKGAVSVEWKNVRGSGVKTFKGPCHFIIRADTFHTITGLEPENIWACLFVPPPEFETDLIAFWNEAESVE